MLWFIYLTRLQPAVEVLKAQKPTRAAIFLRTEPPLYSDNYGDVVLQTCPILDILRHRSRLLAIQKWPRLSTFIFDVFHDDYDVSTGHHKINLPVLHVDYGRSRSHVRIASAQFQDLINTHVATQHDYHGWDAEPPYF